MNEPMLWHLSFHSGAAVVVWCIFWWIGVSDSPHIDTTISIEEKKYIEENTDKLDTKKVCKNWFLKFLK